MAASKQSAMESVERLKDEISSKEKELRVWNGESEELRKMEMAELHEFELKLIGTLQRVREAANRRYENERECRICMEQRANTVLVPCGHCLCTQCGRKIQKCPMCRAPIQRRVEMK